MQMNIFHELNLSNDNTHCINQYVSNINLIQSKSKHLAS